MFSKEIYGQRIKETRKKAGDTQTVVAELIDAGKSHVSEIENGIKCTTVEGLYNICKHYKVSADYLLGLKDEP